MRYYIASDHAGFRLKAELIKHLNQKGFEVRDLGTDSEESCDYPDYALKAAQKVAGEDAKGILICGTGIGSCISANKVKGIRAALIHSEFTGRMAKEHNNANIVCLGARAVDLETAKKSVDAWLEAEFQGGRHERRVKKITQFEKKA